MPVGPNILWPLKARKSTPSSATSSGQVGHRLAGVQHRQGADLPGPPHQRGDRVDGAEHVGHVGEREDLGALGQERVEVGEVEPALVGDRHPAQGRAGAAGQLLPRDEVGVVLHLGDDDLVAGPEQRSGARPPARRRPSAAGGGVGERVGDEVERLGGVLGEHHLVGPAPRRTAATCRRARLVGVGGLLGELVRAPVDRGVVPLVELPLGVQHLHRLLRGRPRVEVDQRGPSRTVRDRIGKSARMRDDSSAGNAVAVPGAGARSVTAAVLRPRP